MIYSISTRKITEKCSLDARTFTVSLCLFNGVTVLFSIFIAEVSYVYVRVSAFSGTENTGSISAKV